MTEDRLSSPTPEDLGAPIGIGRTALVYALPDRQVVKVFNDATESEVDAEKATFDRAHDAGATPLVCHGRHDVGDAPGLAFDRADGDSLNDWAKHNPLTRAREAGRILAREHVRMHKISGVGLPDPRELACQQLDTEPLASLSPTVRAAAAAQVQSLPAGSTLLHMDFHTQSIFEHQGGWAIIDWPTAMCGHPACDVANTAMLLRDAALWPGTPLFVRVAAAVVRRQMAKAYLQEYLDLTKITREDVDAWRLAILILRVGGFRIESERERFLAEITELGTPNPA